MKLKKMLAAFSIAAMVTAAVPLSASISAEEHNEYGSFYAIFDPSTGEVKYITDDFEDMLSYNGDFESGAWYDCVRLNDGTLSVNISAIMKDWHANCKHSITIPSEINGYTVTEIVRNCWGGYMSITIPDTVKKIDENVFAHNYYLEEIIFDEKSQLEVIGKLAFQDCRSLRSITIPATVKEIGYGAFLNSIDKVDDVDFKDLYSLTTIKFSEGSQLETIGEWAFQGQHALTSIELPDSVMKIYIGAFNRCTSLAEIDLPYSITEIAPATFQHCESLKKIEIPDRVTEIGEYTFFDCPTLEEITIPSGVTVIGDYTFYNCTSLAKITIPASISAISETAFTDCSDDLTIYGYAGTYAEKYAEEYEIGFVTLPLTLEDEENETGVTVEGAVPYDTVLTVEKNEGTETGIAYDITLKDSNGNTIRPSTEVTVKIPAPTDWNTADIKVYRAETDGKYTDMNAKYSDGYMIFTTDHFSTYILSTVDLTEKEDEGPTGGSTGGNTTGSSSTTTTTTTTTTTEAAATTTTTTTAPAATTTATANTSGAGSGEDRNVNTGATILIIPAIAAAAGVIISKKRK